MVKRYFLVFIGVFCFVPWCAAQIRINAGKAKTPAWRPVFNLGSIDSEVKLNNAWRFKNGDSAIWADAALNDTRWDTVTNPSDPIEEKKFTGRCWLRLHLKVSPSLFNKTVLLQVYQIGASEIYLNGKLVHSFGKVGDERTEVPYNPANRVFFLQLAGDTMQVIAIRFSSVKAIKQIFLKPQLRVSLDGIKQLNSIIREEQGEWIRSVTFSAVFLAFALFHFLLFLYYRKTITNLYYSVLALLLSFFWLSTYLSYEITNTSVLAYVTQIYSLIYAPCFFLIFLILYSIFKEKFNWFFWVLVCLFILTEIFSFLYPSVFALLLVIVIIASSVKGVNMIISAIRKKSPGAKILGAGFFIFFSIILIVFLYVAVLAITSAIEHKAISDDLIQRVTGPAEMIWALSIPTCMSFYLASDFARTNKHLVLQLVHVRQLSDQNIAKERERQLLIEKQKEDLEVKVKQAIVEISQQKDELAEKNKEITDSINYARRIQTSILPEDDLMRDALGDHMIIYKPKDVVSGDFYWCHIIGDKVIFAVADCTGHGVPGAFMSMIGNSLLNEIVLGEQITEANTILDALRSKLVITLQQSDQHITTRDGMDIALCVWNKKENTLQFAGANNSVYLLSKDIAVNGSIKETSRVKLSNNHLMEILPDKQPIGYQEGKMTEPFTKIIIQLHKGDSIFVTSDGFTDQFGGDRNKKFTSKRFRELIASLVDLPIAEQKIIIEETIENWKRNESQTDDICVLGIRV